MKETMAMRAPLLERLEELLDRGGTKKDVALLAVSAVALGFSFFAPETLPFNPAWIAIVLCGAPIILGGSARRAPVPKGPARCQPERGAPFHPAVMRPVSGAPRGRGGRSVARKISSCWRSARRLW